MKRLMKPLNGFWHNLHGTLRGRVTIGMTILFVAFMILLAFSFETTIDIRSESPIGLHTLCSDPLDVNDPYVRSAQLWFTIDYVRGAILRNMSVIACIGSIFVYRLAGRILRPLNQVTQTVEQISVGTLDTRLDTTAATGELKTLALGFNRMLDRLAQAFEQQERFVGGAAHELRTPLATLRATLETLPAADDMTPDDYREMAQTFDRTLNRLEKLVTDLLLVTAGEQQMHDDEVVLGVVLEEVIHDLTPLAHEQRVTIEYRGDADATVTGEASLIGMVFANLIENGIRYNHPQGRVLVYIECESQQVVVRVSDTGMGISVYDQRHVFDRFYRVDRSRARHKGGAGLGLALVEHIVRRYGGAIRLTSTLGQGSTFIVTLPRLLPRDDASNTAQS
jgi:signal transduction histidine kinase